MTRRPVRPFRPLRPLAIATLVLLGAALSCTLQAATPAETEAGPAGSAAATGAAATGAAVTSAAVTGAASASAPAPQVPAARPSVFVLFDIEMEAAALGNSPPAVRQAREAARQLAFDAITARLKAWGERNGVTLETAVFSSRRKIDLGGRKFSHLLVEKISQAALEDGGADGARVSTRKWTATAYDTSVPGAKAPARLGSDSFLSDGSACFESDAAAQADCRSAYLRLLSQHLRWIDARWGEVETTAAPEGAAAAPSAPRR